MEGGYQTGPTAPSPIPPRPPNRTQTRQLLSDASWKKAQKSERKELLGTGGGGSPVGHLLPAHPACLGRAVPPFLSTPYPPLLTLLLSRGFYFLTSPPLFLHKRTLSFGLFPERLTAHQQGTHLQNEPPLPSLPVSHISGSRSSLQESSPSASSVPF